ncbi:MAG: hypothetical protein ABII02_04290, partial [Candidatus Magasanikbacteria bacterium]
SASQYNIASTINTNITSFSTSTGNIIFKAFLESDGTQLVQLDEVGIGYYGSVGDGSPASQGYLISSAFDMTTSSEIQVIEWDQVIPSCSPTCEIKLQVRAAPDSSGSPGTWTPWYGEIGVGDYFTVSAGTLLPTILNGNQWVQYRAELIGDGVDTPILEEVRLNYK